MVRLKKELVEMKANCDKCWAANETLRMQAFEARKAVEACEGGRWETEKARDEPAKAGGRLQGDVDSME